MIVISLPCSIYEYGIIAPDNIQNQLKDKFYPFVMNEPQGLSLYYFQVENNSMILKDDKQNQLKHYTARDDRELLNIIIETIRYHVVLIKGYTIMHAATCSINGKTLILIGDSGTGKSVFSYYNNQFSDFECLSDDLAIINYEDHTIAPMSKYLYLRESYKQCCELKSNKNLIFDPFVERYKSVLSFKSNTDFRLYNAILILERHNDIKSPMIKDYGTKNNFIRVLKSMYCPYQMKSNIHASSEIVSNVKVTTLHYNHLRGTHQLIKDFIDSS